MDGRTDERCQNHRTLAKRESNKITVLFQAIHDIHDIYDIMVNQSFKEFRSHDAGQTSSSTNEVARFCPAASITSSHEYHGLINCFHPLQSPSQISLPSFSDNFRKGRIFRQVRYSYNDFFSKNFFYSTNELLFFSPSQKTFSTLLHRFVLYSSFIADTFIFHSPFQIFFTT